jgi:hypothetical protein
MIDMVNFIPCDPQLPRLSPIPLWPPGLCKIHLPWTIQNVAFSGNVFCNMTNNDMYINGVSPDNPLVEPFE